jgi:signal transduction histidine kinase
MELSLDNCDVRDAVKAAVTDTASLRSAKDQECVVELPVEVSIEVLADTVRVRQILFNLLSNASKFTPDRGKITVSAVRTVAPMPASVRSVGEPGAKLVTRDVVWVSVSDTGVGIKPDDMSKLFKEFSQVDSSASRAAQGTGLGLALCKRFVELHGGQIGVESIEGRGSTFWFILPVDGPPADAPIKGDAAAA